ncbi:10096_t:CDS:2 [Gigaspora margarita]|uniref:10096_t:CDS:1 n=1 Tax=Gigaspora margarita TaxID=4874 RepID=A0ABN7UWU0_GIGMA|nr:10096_t:CDS:2 [Gigaspora margarita]
MVDRKKKIYAEIEELLGHQLQKKQTEMERYYEGVWSQKERQTYEVTRLFPKIADELWKVQKEWEIEDVTKQRAI